MAGFGVGVMHHTINSRFGPKPLIHADYMTGMACGADSFWVADRRPPQLGAAAVDVDAQACGRSPADPQDGRPPRAVDHAGVAVREEVVLQCR
jgi:hypothetical protein